MSALEENLTTEISDGGLPDSAPVTGAVEGPPSAPTAPPPNESRRDTLLRVAQATQPAEKVRDTRGKFAAALGTEAPAPVVEAPTRPAMPKSFNKELEAHWNTAHPELLSKFVQRELDTEKGVAPLKERAKQADELLNEFKPYEAQMRMNNATPQTVMRDYLRTAAIFQTGTPSLKVQAVAELIRQHSIPIEHLQQMLNGSAPPQQGYGPAEINQLVEQRFSAFQKQQAEQAGEAEIAKFAGANPHFEALQDWMADLMRTDKFVSANQGKSAQDKLKAAYDLAIRMDPDISKQVAAEQQAAAVAEKQVAQARKAAVLVKGSPPSGTVTKIDPTDRRAFIANQVQAHR